MPAIFPNAFSGILARDFRSDLASEISVSQGVVEMLSTTMGSPVKIGEESGKE